MSRRRTGKRARAALIDTPLDPARTVVRINPRDTADHAPDLDALAKTSYTTVMLAKTEDPQQIRDLAPLDVVVLIETPLGAVVVNETGAHGQRLRAHVGRRGPVRGDGRHRQPVGPTAATATSPGMSARRRLLAAKAYGRMALDSVYLDIKNLDGLRGEADDAVAVGFDAKVAIHPTQVAVIREGYAPTDEQVDWARRVLDTARGERGVFQFEGIMVDAPVLRRAERIVQLAPHPGT